jgi:hypothetical protein
MTSSSPGRADGTALRARCPLSRAGKEIILTTDTTDVGVDAVLSADVDDAPMRQRQYTAPVETPSAPNTPGYAQTLRFTVFLSTSRRSLPESM